MNIVLARIGFSLE